MASPSQFFDPFFSSSLDLTPQVSGEPPPQTEPTSAPTAGSDNLEWSSQGLLTGATSALTIASHLPAAGVISLTGPLPPAPKPESSPTTDRKPTPPVNEYKLPVPGQGTIAVSSNPGDTFTLAVGSEEWEALLLMRVGTDSCKLSYTSGDGSIVDIRSVEVPATGAATKKAGIKTTNWLSIDHKNGILRYGKHYTNVKNTLLCVDLKKKDNDKGISVWNQGGYAWIEKLNTVRIVHEGAKVKISALPVVLDHSPFIKPSTQISLLELESGAYTVPANLPVACQQLYDNIYGVELDDGSFKDFATAINWSCKDEGYWANKKLKEKAEKGVLGNNIKGTYLRITMGWNLGDSPGIPYVLEIWPPGHFSPIHDHGNACGVIKVLHGEIDATFYSEFDVPQEIGTARFLKGNITWLGDQNYQVHKLHNKSETDVCVTIQCYRYADHANVYEDVFRFERDGNIESFIPNSDLSFKEFRDEMRAEWERCPLNPDRKGVMKI